MKLFVGYLSPGQSHFNSSFSEAKINVLRILSMNKILSLIRQHTLIDRRRPYLLTFPYLVGSMWTSTSVGLQTQYYTQRNIDAVVRSCGILCEYVHVLSELTQALEKV